MQLRVGVPEEAVTTETVKKLKKIKRLTSREDYESAMENLRRLSEMLGKPITQPSGIVRRTSRGQWQTRPTLRRVIYPYSSCGHGRAK